MKLFYLGVSGRGVGKILGINKADVYNWIKKQMTITEKIKNNFKIDYLELDELYWEKI